MLHLLVPPVKSGGVYDFARKLREVIRHDAVRFVHLSKEYASNWEVGPDDTVILQMSGYGFDKRGAPLWLLHELENRRKQIKTFGVFFHELYAFGPPWSSSFWLSPVQRHIARRLAKMADFWLTNRAGSAEWLEVFAGEKPHAVLPVFSNVGEMDAFPQTRLPKVIVFGSAGLRQATYQAAGDKLFAWAKLASLDIHDIGEPLADRQLADRLSAQGVVIRGRLDEEEISRAMKDAMFGLLTYPVAYVAKSGVFAAYCAHGTCPILISQSYVPADRLVARCQYLPGFADSVISPVGANAVGRAAYEWYQSHRLQRHAETIRGFVLDREGL